MRTPATILFGLMISASALCQGVKLSELPISTDVSTNTWLLISDLDLTAAEATRRLSVYSLGAAITNQMNIVADASIAIPNSVFLAETGDDDTAERGKANLPFSTLRAATRALQSGDILVIRPGQYTVPALYYNTDIGEIDQDFYLKDLTNVTIQGYGAQLNADSYGNMLTIEGCERITIEGITWVGSEVNLGTNNICAAINHRGTNYHTTIQNCAFIDIPDQAISHCWDQLNRPSFYWTIQNNWFHNIGQTNHPGVIGGGGVPIPDGSMVSGRPRRLIFTGNRSTGLNMYGVEFDGGGDNSPANDPEIKNSVVANNVLEGIYYQGVLLMGKGDIPVQDVTISGNVLSWHTNLVATSLSSALIHLAGSRNIVVIGNNLTGPVLDQGSGTMILVDNPLGDGLHPVSQGINITGNTIKGGSHGMVIAQTVGVASIVDGVRIVNNVFRAQGASHISVAGTAIHIVGNSLLGCGLYGGTVWTQAVRLWDFDGAPATGFVMRDNILDDVWSPPNTTRFLRAFSDLTPRTPLDIRNNLWIRMSGTTPYEFSSDTPIRGDTVDLTDATLIATPAIEGSQFRVVLGGNRTLSNPTNPYDGQIVTWELIQDDTGSRLLTLGNKFVTGIFDVTLSTTPDYHDFLTARYNADDDLWYVMAFVNETSSGTGIGSGSFVATGDIDLNGFDVLNAGTLYLNQLTSVNTIFETAPTNDWASGVPTLGGYNSYKQSTQVSIGEGLTLVDNILTATNSGGAASDTPDWDIDETMVSTNDTPFSLASLEIATNTTYHIRVDVLAAGATNMLSADVRTSGRRLETNTVPNPTVSIVQYESGQAALETNVWFDVVDNYLRLRAKGVDGENIAWSARGRFKSVANGEAAPGPAYLVQEGFEGVGAPDDWSGTYADFDVVDPVAAVGSESMMVYSAVAAVTATSPTFADTSNFHMFCRFMFPTNVSSANRPIIELRNGTTSLVQLYVNTDNKLYLSNPVTVVSDAMLVDTWYYIWYSYNSGTGLHKVAFSDDGTKYTSGTKFASGTRDPGLPVNSVRFRSYFSTTPFKVYFDDVRVAAQEIP